MVWLEPTLLGSRPPGRGGCAAAVVGDACIFIGGADRTPKALDDVWILKFERSMPLTARWIRKTTTTRGDEKLPARSGASATAIGTDVYVFGGQDPSTGVCFNDVVVLDTTSWQWRRLILAESGSPPPRNGHVACAAFGGKALVIHGGSSPEEGPMGDVHVLNLEEGSEKWERPRVAGQAPEPREMHAGVSFSSRVGETLVDASKEPSNEELLVFGGRGREGAVLRDAHVLDVRAMRWTRRGDLGEALCAHAAAPWRVPGEENFLKRKPAAAFFGGFDGANLRSSDVSLLEPETLAKTVLSGSVSAASASADSPFKSPQARFAPSCVAVDACLAAGTNESFATSSIPVLVVFGGLTPTSDLADVTAWMDGPDYARAALAATTEPSKPAVAPASDLD